MTSNSSELFPKRHLGQHFLIDKNIIHKMISASCFQPQEMILEIGPGLGALTKEMIGKVKKIIAIEKDLRFVEQLKEDFPSDSLTVIHADFLKFPIESLPKNVKLIGNLPYYIATPIMERILNFRKYFSKIYLTVQWELGKRMTALHGCKEYGAFSLFVQFYSQPKILFKIKKTCFDPIPQVDSCFIEMNIHTQTTHQVKEEKLLFQIIQTAFQQRRKTINNALRNFLKQEERNQILKKFQLRENLRPENLTLKNYVDLTNEIYSLKKGK